MDFPASLALEALEAQHPEYAAIAPTLTKIDDLANGGWQIEAHKAKYLQARPGEEDELYKIRLSRFTYVNVLGEAIAQQSGKLASGSLVVNEFSDADFLNAFREDNDGAGRSEKRLIADAFRIALKFKRVFFHAEKPYAQVQPQTRQQEEALGLLPYICIYSPLQVISWGEERTGLSWIKIRQVAQVPDPFGKPKTKATWTIITREQVCKYEAPVRLGKDGAIAAILTEAGEDAEENKVGRSRLVAHGAGRLPIVKLEIPDDMWAVNQAYLLALQHLNLLNSQYDTAMMAGYVQRVYRPYTTPDNDLDNTFVNTEGDEIKSGNQYILKADHFSFSEAQGSSVATVGGLLAQLEYKIKDLMGLSGASAEHGAVMQSGVSKRMDFVLQEVMLRAFGQLVCDAYQDVLQLVARLHGLRWEEISVSGLDSFDIDSLESMLAIALQINEVAALLPPTALKLFYQQFTSLLIRNASAEQQEQINAELERIFGAIATGVGNEASNVQPDDSAGDGLGTADSVESDGGADGGGGEGGD